MSRRAVRMLVFLAEIWSFNFAALSMRACCDLLAGTFIASFKSFRLRYALSLTQQLFYVRHVFRLEVHALLQQ